jgi:hypothetical protein
VVSNQIQPNREFSRTCQNKIIENLGYRKDIESSQIRDIKYSRKLQYSFPVDSLAEILQARRE